jgi:hypothetical protein
MSDAEVNLVLDRPALVSDVRGSDAPHPFTAGASHARFMRDRGGGSRRASRFARPLDPRNQANVVTGGDPKRTPRLFHTRGVAGSIPAAPTFARQQSGEEGRPSSEHWGAESGADRLVPPRRRQGSDRPSASYVVLFPRRVASTVQGR